MATQVLRQPHPESGVQLSCFGSGEAFGLAIVVRSYAPNSHPCRLGTCRVRASRQRQIGDAGLRPSCVDPCAAARLSAMVFKLPTWRSTNFVRGANETNSLPKLAVALASVSSRIWFMAQRNQGGIVQRSARWPWPPQPLVALHGSRRPSR